MKRYLVGVTLFALAVPFSAFAFVGCGSDESDTSDQNADGGDGGTADGAGNEAGPRPDCKQVGAACGTSGDCCTANCDSATKLCAPPPNGSCGAPAATCNSGLDCCTTSCVGGTCSNKQCIADNQACAADGECCGGKCDAGKCTPLNTTCKTSGNPCAGNGECCSSFCNNGICNGSPSFCRQTGDACVNDLDCCGGACTKTAGATLGVCALAPASGASQCLPAGTVCSPSGACNTNACCSRSCEPYAATKITICQPPSGCHPTGELCQKDSDCCGAIGSAEPMADQVNTHCSKAPGATVGRCDQGHTCSPAGSICRLAAFSCESTDRCCSGTVQQVKTNCVQDNLGIPRCLTGTSVNCATPPPAGTACASSADCCNKPCTPDATGKLVCSGAACQPTGATCTTTADCCAGEPCIVQPGSDVGKCGASGTATDGGTGGTDAGTGGTGGSTTCAQYGQQCNGPSDCCNGVPCTNGYCINPVK